MIYLIVVDRWQTWPRGSTPVASHDVPTGLADGAIGCWHTEVQPPANPGGGDDDGAGHGGQSDNYRIERVDLDPDQLRVRAGLYRRCAGRTGSGRGIADRCPARRLRPPLTGGRNGGRVPASKRRALLRHTGDDNGATTSTSAKNGGPATPCQTPRWCVANSGMSKVEVVGLSREKMEETFWDTIAQVSTDLTGI